MAEAGETQGVVPYSIGNLADVDGTAPTVVSFLKWHVANAEWTVQAQAAAQVNSVAADVATLVTDFNALLAKLRTVGIIAP